MQVVHIVGPGCAVPVEQPGHEQRVQLLHPGIGEPGDYGPGPFVEPEFNVHALGGLPHLLLHHPKVPIAGVPVKLLQADQARVEQRLGKGLARPQAQHRNQFLRGKGVGSVDLHRAHRHPDQPGGKDQGTDADGFTSATGARLPLPS